MEELVREPAWSLLCNKLDELGYERLNEYERIWINIDGLIGDVSGGGLISFFYNHGADNYEDTIDDLKRINAKKAITLVKKIGDKFPGGLPPKDIDKRNEIIESWHHDDLNDFFEGLDDKFYEIMDDLEHKLESIIKKVIDSQS